MDLSELSPLLLAPDAPLPAEAEAAEAEAESEFEGGSASECVRPKHRCAWPALTRGAPARQERLRAQAQAQPRSCAEARGQGRHGGGAKAESRSQQGGSFGGG